MRQNPLALFLVVITVGLGLLPSNGFVFTGKSSPRGSRRICESSKTIAKRRQQQQPTTLAQAKFTKETGFKGGFRANSPSYGGYNDDAFGLVFLSGLALTQDVAFEVAFVGLSAAAAAATSSGIWNDENDARIPGAVALTALVVGRPLVGFVFLPVFTQKASPNLTEGLSNLPPFTAIPPLIEIGICAISVAWAFFNWNSFKENSSA